MTVNLFPATVIGPSTNLRSARVYCTDTHCWIVDWDSNSQPYLANHFTVVSIDNARRGTRAYTVTDSDGNEWMLMKGGGCPCSHPGKGLDVPSYLASQGIYV